MSFGFEVFSEPPFGAMQITAGNIAYYHDATHTMTEDRFLGTTGAENLWSHKKDVTCIGTPIIAIDVPVCPNAPTRWDVEGVALCGHHRVNTNTWRVYAWTHFGAPAPTIHVFRPFSDLTPSESHGLRVWDSSGVLGFATEKNPFEANAQDVAVFWQYGHNDLSLGEGLTLYDENIPWPTGGTVNFSQSGGYSMIGNTRPPCTVFWIGNGENWLFAKVYAQKYNENVIQSWWAHCGGNTTSQNVGVQAYNSTRSGMYRYVHFIPRPAL